MKTVLVVDDEKNIRNSLEGVLNDEGFDVVFAESSEEALTKIKQSAPDIILLDIWLPGTDGMEALKKIKEEHEHLPVIMISGHGTVETAVKATKLGAYDFLEKPLSIEKVVLTIEHALEQKRLLEENIELQERAKEKYEIIGKAKVMEERKRDIKRVAPTYFWWRRTCEKAAAKDIGRRNTETR